MWSCWLQNRLAAIEDSISSIALAAMVLLPLIELLSRALIDEGIPGSIGYVQHLTLWIGFLGAALATREKRHLALSAAPDLLKNPGLQRAAGILAHAAAAAVSILLAIASAKFVWAERESQTVLGGGVPLWIVQAIMPAGFGLTGFRFLFLTPRP